MKPCLIHESYFGLLNMVEDITSAHRVADSVSLQWQDRHYGITARENDYGAHTWHSATVYFSAAGHEELLNGLVEEL